MKRLITTLTLVFSLLFPTLAIGQSGDASWLQNLTGLQSAIGRSWMAPLDVTQVYSETDPDSGGTPVGEPGFSTPVASPVSESQPQTLMMSVFVFEFDTDTNAAEGLEKLNAEQLAIHERDPRSPAVNAFDPGIGDSAYGYDGAYEVQTIDSSGAVHLSVVYLMVQDGNAVYQLFGQFLPGNHQQIATDAVSDLIDTEPGSATTSYDANGGSTGGMWEKLNAVQTAFPQDVTINDLEIWPTDSASANAQDIQVPVISLDELGQLPRFQNGWHITYGPETPVDAEEIPEGVFSIEIWILEFDDDTQAGAASFALQSSLAEPLGITEGSTSQFTDRNNAQTVSSTSIGFVRDRDLPEGDAAFVVVWSNTTVYAVRVYSNGPAPQAVATDVMQHVLDTEASSEPESETSNAATGGSWARFPEPGSDLLYGMEPVKIERIHPEKPQATPESTPQ